MLRLEDVTVKQGAFALNASLELAKGARVALMGASGSGKSTLLSVIAGFLLADRGQVWMDGTNVTDTPVADRPLSILFQDGNLFPHLTAFQNVALGISPSLRLDPKARHRVEDALGRVGLDGMAGRKPAALSGGQQSRVALARMLLQNKPLVLLDEPFAALDPGLRAEMLCLTLEMCEASGQTLIMATHDLRDAEKLCDRVVLLDDGGVALNEDLSAAIARQAPALQSWM